MNTSTPSNDGGSTFTSSSTLGPIVMANVEANSGKKVAASRIPSAPLHITFPKNVTDNPRRDSTVARPCEQVLEVKEEAVKSLLIIKF